MIYLDNAATTWPKPEIVYQAVDACLRGIGGNPGRGGHSMARQANQTLFDAREQVAALWGVNDSSRIGFVASATDGLNTVLQGALNPGDVVVTTSMEHNAVARPLRFLESQGITLRIVGCNSDGSLPLDAMQAALADSPKALVMAHASNVTGGIMPVRDIKNLLRGRTMFILDAAQTAGIEPIDVNELKVDVVVASGHKGLLGPQGTGCLYVREGIAIRPLRFGGTGSLSESDIQPDFMPDCLESGTQNTPGIAGLAAGVAFIKQTGIEKIATRERHLAVEIVKNLRAMKNVRVLGWSNMDRQTAVVSAVFEKCDSGWLAGRLSESEIACRSGLQCAPWAHKTLGTLGTGALRLSPGFFTSEQEIEKTLAAIEQILSE